MKASHTINDEYKQSRSHLRQVPNLQVETDDEGVPAHPEDQPYCILPNTQGHQSISDTNYTTRALGSTCDIMWRWGVHSQRWGIWSETARCRTCPGWRPWCAGSWPGWEPTGNPENQTPASERLPPRGQGEEGESVEEGVAWTHTSEVSHTHPNAHKWEYTQIHIWKHNPRNHTHTHRHKHSHTERQGHTYMHRSAAVVSMVTAWSTSQSSDCKRGAPPKSSPKLMRIYGPNPPATQQLIRLANNGLTLLLLLLLPCLHHALHSNRYFCLILHTYYIL